MQRCLDFWYGLTPRGRVAMWLMLTCCLAACLWWMAVRPAGNRLAQLKTEHVTQQVTLRQHYQQTHVLHPPEGQAERQPVRPFLPLDFAPPHASLTHWQPTLNGGELVLSARWAQAVTTFAQLAEYDMVVRGFTLEPEGLQLRFTLQLETANDT